MYVCMHVCITCPKSQNVMNKTPKSFFRKMLSWKMQPKAYRKKAESMVMTVWYMCHESLQYYKHLVKVCPLDMRLHGWKKLRICSCMSGWVVPQDVCLRCCTKACNVLHLVSTWICKFIQETEEIMVTCVYLVYIPWKSAVWQVFGHHIYAWFAHTSKNKATAW